MTIVLDECNSVPSEEHACQDSKLSGDKNGNALKFCKKLLADKRFAPCHAVSTIKLLKIYIQGWRTA